MHGLVLRNRDYNLAPSALVAAVSKISEVSLTKTTFVAVNRMDALEGFYVQSVPVLPLHAFL